MAVNEYRQAQKSLYGAIVDLMVTIEGPASIATNSLEMDVLKSALALMNSVEENLDRKAAEYERR